MEWVQNGSNMVWFGSFDCESCSCILDSLKSIKKVLRYTREQSITIVQSGKYKGRDECFLYTEPLSDIIERHSSSCTQSLCLISLNTTLHPVHRGSVWYHWTSLFILYTQLLSDIIEHSLFILYTEPLSDIIERHSSSCTQSLCLISLNTTLHPVHTASTWYHWTSLCPT